jgi:hypothetical protein
MPWFRVDDGFPGHPKTRSIPRAARMRAVGVWTSCGTWSAHYLTDGSIPAGTVEDEGGKPADSKALVASGLWHAPGHECPRCPQPVPGHFQFHDWPDYQPTKAEVEEERERKARAGRAGGKRSGQVRGSRTEAPASPVLPDPFTDGSPDASGTAEPPIPIPIPSPNYLLTTVSRLTSSDAQATTTDDELAYWKTLAGQADLADEARAFLAYNAHTDIRDWRNAWHGWLRKASERAGPPPALPPGCDQCLDGWLPDSADGRPRPCPTCKPHALPRTA